MAGRIARKAQKRTRRVYDYRVVLERDEGTRRMKLPLGLYGTDEMATLGAWVLLEARFRTASKRPCCGPDSTRHDQVGKAITSQCSPYRQCAVMCLLVFSVLL